jgi:hypothetical protein
LVGVLSRGWLLRHVHLFRSLLRRYFGSHAFCCWLYRWRCRALGSGSSLVGWPSELFWQQTCGTTERYPRWFTTRLTLRPCCELAPTWGFSGSKFTAPMVLPLFTHNVRCQSQMLIVRLNTMSDNSVRLSLLALAGGVMPVAYLALCAWMYLRRVWWFTYLAFFFIFGAIGGWCFALAMSPSGLTATSIVFLVSFAVVACLTAAVVLHFRKQKGPFEKLAMFGGYAYPLLVVANFIRVVVFSQSAR